mgnify:CR=1 FL=1
MKNSLLILLVLCMVSCAKKIKEPKKGYELNGVVKNLADSTQVIMYMGNIPIDSTIAIDGKFKFTGSVEEPSSVGLLTKKAKTINHTAFWLENSSIDFIAEAGKFKEAKISGSSIQKEDDIPVARIFNKNLPIKL